MSKIKVIVLAGGKGTRMKSNLPKVLHKVYDKSMIECVYTACNKANVDDIYVIVGHKKDEVIEHLKDKKVTCIYQAEQLGTGHAAMQAKEYINDDDIVMVVSGDVPLITSETITEMIEYYKQNIHKAVIMSAIVDNPNTYCYGRVIRDENKNLMNVIEQKDASEEIKLIKEVNMGSYVFNGKLLKESFELLNNNNAQNEYYITDIPKIIIEKGYTSGVYTVKDVSEVTGVNSRQDLANVTTIMLNKIRNKWMKEGVTLIDPLNTYIGNDVVIGKDTIIYPGNVILGNTVIGDNCILYSNNNIENSNIGDNINIGPFANIRANNDIKDNTKIGAYVELKNSKIGESAKISHHIYLGDSIVGNNAEIGCGVITANMNTKWEKKQTQIEDGAFIGCNSVLIAPVTIEKDAVVAASTVVTKDINKNALAISRCELLVKDNYKK